MSHGFTKDRSHYPQQMFLFDELIDFLDKGKAIGLI